MSLYSALASRLMRYYDRGAVTVPADFVRSRLEAVPELANAYFSLKDGDYLLLEPERLRSFLDDKVWAQLMRYKTEVFDCDDFAACARADILRAGKLCGFPRATFVAEVCYYPVQGEYHAAVLVMDAAGKIYLYEPQTGELTGDLAGRIREATDIWG